MEKVINVTDKYVAFWGSIFSNFYPCTFVNEDGNWSYSEQYFMWQKAKFFGDDEIADEIYNEQNPGKCKKLGRKVKNFDDSKWGKYAYQAMKKAVYDKFSQNKFLKEELLSDKYAGKHFVEGSPFDGRWGIKLIYTSDTIDDESTWNGLNWLGKVLDEVREMLK